VFINMLINNNSNTVMTNVIYFRTLTKTLFSNNIVTLTYLFRTAGSPRGCTDVKLKGIDKNLLRRAESDFHRDDKKSDQEIIFKSVSHIDNNISRQMGRSIIYIFLSSRMYYTHYYLLLTIKCQLSNYSHHECKIFTFTTYLPTVIIYIYYIIL